MKGGAPLPRLIGQRGDSPRAPKGPVAYASSFSDAVLVMRAVKQQISFTTNSDGQDTLPAMVDLARECSEVNYLLQKQGVWVGPTEQRHECEILSADCNAAENLVHELEDQLIKTQQELAAFKEARALKYDSTGQVLKKVWSCALVVRHRPNLC